MNIGWMPTVAPVRGMAIHYGRSDTVSVRAPITTMSSSTPAAIAARATLGSLAAKVEEHLAAVAATADPEHLHDLRIAIRRTRSILRELRTELPAAQVALGKAVFGQLADATGAPRDLDVYLAQWEHLVADLDPAQVRALGPVRAELEDRRRLAYERLRDVVRSSEVIKGLADWSAFTTGPEVDTSGQTIGTAVTKRVAKLHRRLVRDGRRIEPTSTGELLHELRKDGKRLRYLVECFAPLFDKGTRRAYLRRLKDLQDNLGAHQDAEVQVALLRELALGLNDGSASATDLVLALGQLSGRGDDRRHAARAEFVERFGAYDSSKTVKLLDRLVASAGG